MNAVTVDIKDILEGESKLGLVFTDNLFIGQEPTSPANCVTIFDRPSSPPQLNYDRFEIYEYPSIQIRCRNTSYVNAEAEARAIYLFLHGLTTEINHTLYTLIRCMQTPVLLDWDENNRARFIVNFEIQRRTN